MTPAEIEAIKHIKEGLEVEGLSEEEIESYITLTKDIWEEEKNGN